MTEPIVLPPHPWSSDIKEYFDLDGASVGTVGYVYDANGVELAVVYRMLDHPAVLPLLTAAPELFEALRDLVNVIAVDDLVPESVSYMRQTRAALAKAEGAL